MPLWGWIVILVVVSAIMLPIKMRILKKLTTKKEQNIDDEE